MNTLKRQKQNSKNKEKNLQEVIEKNNISQE